MHIFIHIWILYICVESVVPLSLLIVHSPRKTGLSDKKEYQSEHALNVYWSVAVAGFVGALNAFQTCSTSVQTASTQLFSALVSIECSYLRRHCFPVLSMLLLLPYLYDCYSFFLIVCSCTFFLFFYLFVGILVKNFWGVEVVVCIVVVWRRS